MFTRFWVVLMKRFADFEDGKSFGTFQRETVFSKTEYELKQLFLFPQSSPPFSFTNKRKEENCLS